MRGLAALNVLLAHFVAAFFPSLLLDNYPGITSHPQNYKWLHVLQLPGLNIIYNGHFAVILFFIISGYVLSEKHNTEKFQNRLRCRFWGRFFRLIPLLFVTFIISFIFIHIDFYFNNDVTLLEPKLDWIGHFMPEVSFLEFVEISLFKGILFGDGRINPPIWTISIELYGSLLILGFLIISNKRNILIKMSAIFLIIIIVTPQNFIYIVCFFMGSLLKFFDKKFDKLHIAILLIGLYFGSYQYNSVFYKFLPSIGIIGNEKDFYNMIGAIILFIFSISGKINFLLLSKPAIFLGKISYSLYMIHFIILCSLTSFLYVNGVSGWLTPINLLIYLICSILLAIPLTNYIDEPGSRVARRIGKFIEGRL